MESSGVFVPQSLTFVKELGRRLRYQIGKEKADAPNLYLKSTTVLLDNKFKSFTQPQINVKVLLHLRSLQEHFTLYMCWRIILNLILEMMN